eukprot:SAG31_NODE_7907_length_1568_cov_1.371001_1_plen_100_part_00
MAVVLSMPQLPIGSAIPAVGAAIRVEFVGRGAGIFAGVVTRQVVKRRRGFEVLFEADGETALIVPGEHRYELNAEAAAADRKRRRIARSVPDICRCQTF